MTDSESMAALRKAAAIIQRLERRLEAAEQPRTEAVAIVGVGCQLPGGVTDLSGLWRMLQARTDAIQAIPAERFQAVRPYEQSLLEPISQGGVVEGADRFDAEFWGISPHEAAWIDPQHRLLLECAWEALEHAGIPAERLRGSRAGVYVGIGGSADYASRTSLDLLNPVETFTTRLGTSFSAGRISFLLGLQGPSVAIETACSSSLVALHLACQALRRRECELALAAGVQVILSPEPSIILSSIGALAPDGRCKSFSDRADGYARGDGCVVLALKRLTDAQAAGDRILGLVKGSAVNHDGPRSGLTTPNGTAQRELFRQALADAGVTAAEVDYVEAHAIGTSLGDAIEVEALADVYGPGRKAALRVGSLKTNIGHLEPASGLAGVLKVLAAFGAENIPPTLHAERLSAHLDWDVLPIHVVRELEKWPRTQTPRRAAVSAFGLSGTNAHAVLEEAPRLEPVPASAARAGELVVLSAKTPLALNAAARRLHAHLESHPQLPLGDLAFSLATTRSMLDHRLAFALPDRQALLAALLAAGAGQTPAGALRGQARHRTGKLVWFFTGEGAEAPGMGQSLHAEWPAFRTALEGAWQVLDPQLPRPLREVMWAQPNTPAAELLREGRFAQPALFAIQWALAALWRSWGIEPELVIGHAAGEIAAACVAKVFSLPDAGRLVCQRGRLMQALPGGGHAARPAMTSNEARAAFEAPSVVAALREYLSVAESIAYSRPSVACLGELGGAELATPTYWARQPRESLQLTGGEHTLGQLEADTLLELGPNPGLLGTSPHAADARISLLVSMRSGQPENDVILQALGRWVVLGGSADWKAVFPASAQRVELPTYAWQRQRFWMEVGATKAE
jgi:acyl transferase domain-containing protein